jgi:nucleotide-binding universal stress UspA family protein
MKSVVVPITDSKDAQWALNHVIALYRSEGVRIHLLNVQPALSQHISRFFNHGEIRDFHRDNGMLALKPAIDALDGEGVPHWDHVLVGNQAETIVKFAQEYHCSQIVIAKRKDGLLGSFGLGSIGSQIRHLMGAGGNCDVCEVAV